MKRVVRAAIATAIGALLIVLISMMPIGVIFKSILYAVLIVLFVYVVGIIMRIK